MNRHCLLACGVGLAIVMLNADGFNIGSVLSAARAEEAPVGGLAAQLRRQGFRCDKALSAERDAERSKPDEAVWVLKCSDGVYRMRLVPNMAAKVERVE